MKIAHITDTHLGITSMSSLRKMFIQIADEYKRGRFDLLVHTGDYCGGALGSKSVNSTIKELREHYDGPIVSTIGNHDYWSGGTLEGFATNMNAINYTFEKYDVHFIDNDGIYVHPDFPDVKILGCAGWYTNLYPPTNDCMHLPKTIEGVNPNAYLANQSYRCLDRQMEELDKTYDTSDTVVFISHFPVIKVPHKNDYKGSFEDFCWSERIGDLMNTVYGCKYFLNGHAHQLHEGQAMRYEPGTDYGNPRYRVWTII